MTMRRYIDLMEGIEDVATDGFLYHLTSASNRDDILADGLVAGSYFGHLSVIRYYIRMNLHRGTPLVFRIPFARFDAGMFVPDMKGIQDPPSSDVTELTDAEVEEEWDASPQDWKACLGLIGSVQYMQAMRVSESDIFDAKPVSFYD